MFSDLCSNHTTFLVFFLHITASRNCFGMKQLKETSGISGGCACAPTVVNRRNGNLYIEFHTEDMLQSWRTGSDPDIYFLHRPTSRNSSLLEVKWFLYSYKSSRHWLYPADVLTSKLCIRESTEYGIDLYDYIVYTNSSLVIFWIVQYFILV